MKLLIDGDCFAYRYAIAAENRPNLERVSKALTGSVKLIMKDLGATSAVFAIGDRKANFRNNILDTYKMTKARKAPRPKLYDELLMWMSVSFSVVTKPALEGDDILGILATHPTLIKEDKIIVAQDKDLKTIPGKHFDFTKPFQDVIEIDEDQANRFHMYQTLTGDTTDNYKGLPGVGPKKAKVILDQAEDGNYWKPVLEAYKEAGLTRKEALVQARCARILRWEDWNSKKQKPILWTPPK